MESLFSAVSIVLVTTNYYFDHLNFDFYLLMSSFLSNSLSSRGRLDQLPNVGVPCWLLIGLLLQPLDLFLPFLLRFDRSHSLLLDKDCCLLGWVAELCLHLLHLRHWRSARGGVRRLNGFERDVERGLCLHRMVVLIVHGARHTHRVCDRGVHFIVKAITLVEVHLDA